MSGESLQALKRVSATLLGMGQTRLELAGVELAQARQSAIQTIIFGVLLALALGFSSLFVCGLVIYLAWDSSPLWAFLGCALFYLLLGGYFYLRLRSAIDSQTPLFEATIEELGKDKQAIVQSMQRESVNPS